MHKRDSITADAYTTGDRVRILAGIYSGCNATVLHDMPMEGQIEVGVWGQGTLCILDRVAVVRIPYNDPYYEY